jgi:excisionase family DNA binding protein
MRLIRAKEAAELLDLRLPRLYELTRQRLIPSVKVGEKSLRFNEVALREWVERGGLTKDNEAVQVNS